MQFPTIKEKSKLPLEKSFSQMIQTYYDKLEKLQIFNQSEIIFFLIHRFHNCLTPYQVKQYIKQH